MAGEGCLLKNCLNDRRESLKAAAQIRKSSSNPDPCACLRLDHRNRLPRTARTSSGSTPASTLITALPGSSIWIDPDGAIAGAIPDNATLFGSAVTVTGSNLVCACWRHQDSLAILVSPLEHLVRIYSMLTGHSGNRGSRDKRRFYDPTLLLPCPSQPLQGRGRCLNYKRIAHKAIVGQKKPAVYTAKSGRLRYCHRITLSVCPH